MTRRQCAIAAAVVGVVALAALTLFNVNKRAAGARATPAWLDPQQPPETVTPNLLPVPAGQSWAANRCRPMAASCPEHTAGRRVRRIYPGSLADSSGSFVRGFAELEGKVR